MSKTIHSPIQVMIHQSLGAPVRRLSGGSLKSKAIGKKRVGKPRAVAILSKDFKAFHFVPGKKPTSAFTELENPGSQEIGSVMVIPFAKDADLDAVRKMLGKITTRMIAIASPAIYNRPEFRDCLADRNIDAIVEEPEDFELEHLRDWISRIPEILTPAAKRKIKSSPSAAPADMLEFSKRLRDSATGRLDARQFTALLGISLTDLATKVCGISKQALAQCPTSAGIQKKLQPLEEIAQLLFWCGGDEEKLRAWLNRPNRDFPPVEGRAPSPMDLILLGHAGIVANKAHNLRTGHPS